MLITCSNFNHVRSFVGGFLGGMAISHIINSDATNNAISRITQVANRIYNSLTFANVSTFVVTCIGVQLASEIVLPVLSNISILIQRFLNLL